MQAELLELVAEDKKKADKRSSKKKKKPVKASSKTETPGPCTSCAALQRPGSPQPSSPHRLPHTSPHHSPVRHASPLLSHSSRSLSPSSVLTHSVQSPSSQGQSPTLPSRDSAGWEVQARGRKRGEPARKVLADPPSSASQSPSVEHAPSLGSSGHLSRSASPPRPPAPPAPRLSKLGTGDAPTRPLKPHSEASQAQHAKLVTEMIPDSPHIQLVRPPPPPPRPAWGTTATAAGPAVKSATPALASVSRQSQHSSQPLSQLYSLWGGAERSQTEGQTSIWQRGSGLVTRQCKTSTAMRPNAWAVPLTAPKEQLVSPAVQLLLHVHFQ